MNDRPIKSCAKCGCQICRCNKHHVDAAEQSGYAEAFNIEQLLAENKKLKSQIEVLESPKEIDLNSNEHRDQIITKGDVDDLFISIIPLLPQGKDVEKAVRSFSEGMVNMKSSSHELQLLKFTNKMFEKTNEITSSMLEAIKEGR